MENQTSIPAVAGLAAPEQSLIKIRANTVKAECSMRGCVTADGHVVEPSGKQFRALCPFHQEDTPSFYIWDDDQGAKCFGCDWSGDIIDYVRKAHGLEFNAAVEYLEQHGPLRGDARSVPTPEVEEVTAEHLAKIQRDAKRYAENIIHNTTRAENIAAGRPWKSETITKLANEGVLGWEGKALVFIYAGGLKFRPWPGKEFRWDGSASSPWRSAHLQSAAVVYLTEGETDAISMIDAGAEDEAGVAVVAAPSATIFKPEWGPLFMGKKVIVAFDDDDAGRSGTDKVVEVLASHAREVNVLDWSKIKQEVAQ